MVQLSITEFARQTIRDEFDVLFHQMWVHPGKRGRYRTCLDSYVSEI